jgi:hypothetical protein
MLYLPAASYRRDRPSPSTIEALEDSNEVPAVALDFNRRVIDVGLELEKSALLNRGRQVAQFVKCEIVQEALRVRPHVRRDADVGV